MAEKPGYEKLQQRIQELEAVAAQQFTQNKAQERLFNLSQDMLCVADFDGHLRIVNAAFETTLGHSRQAFLDTPFLDFVHPDDKAPTREAMEQLATGVSVTCFENRYRCKDGSYKWLQWAVAPETEAGLMYAVARDITMQKTQQHEEHDLFESILSNVPASIFWKDRNSVYLGSNDRFIRDTGLQGPDEIVGKTDYDFAWTREQADSYRECDRKVMDSGEAMLNIEESQLQGDGTAVHVITSKVPLLDASGQVRGMLGVYMDISDKKRAEEETQRHHQEIAHVIRLSTAGEMASGMAHELNQPLTALASYCGTAKSLVDSMTSPPQQLGEILERAGEQALRAGNIIRHLREFVSKGGDRKETLDIGGVIRDTIEFIKYELQKSDIKIEFHSGSRGCKIKADSIQIEQVLINMVRNSLEAIGDANIPAGRIVLHTRILPHDLVEVTVTDNGPGINAATVNTIFDPFQTNKKTGMGIGLSLSRTIIEAHGGKLWVDKDYQNGARFSFELPVCK